MEQEVEREILKYGYKYRKSKNISRDGSYFKNTYGMDIDKSVKALDQTSVVEALQGIDSVLQEFPKAKSVLTGVSTRNCGIMSTSGNGIVGFNPKYFNARETAIKAHLDTPYHPSNNRSYASGCHEAGYVFEITLIERNGDPYLFAKDWNQSIYAEAVVKSACREARKTPEYKGIKSRELKKQISGYALESESECMAEAVFDYAVNGENAAKLSRIIWKILKKELNSMMDATTLDKFWRYLDFYPEEDEEGYDGIHHGGIRGIAENAPKEAKEAYRQFIEAKKDGRKI